MPTLPEQVRITYIVAIAILFLFVFFIVAFIIVYRKRQQQMILENNFKEVQLKNQLLEQELNTVNMLHAERDRISIDMHDDLGSGLSSIKLISELLKKKHQDEETQKDLNQIVENATELTSTMRDMVWSLNPRNDNLDKFLRHIQQYAKQFFEPSTINLKTTIPTEIPEKTMSGFQRRNIFLTIKEILNNIIKHSKAKEVSIVCIYQENSLRMTFEDNGIGLIENYQPNNGFYSMRKRINDCGGTIEWQNMLPGLKTSIQIPL